VWNWHYLFVSYVLLEIETGTLGRNDDGAELIQMG
jgi:hypothetical protein